MLLADWDAERVPRNAAGIPLDEATDDALKYEWEIPRPRRDHVMRKLIGEQKAFEKAYPHDSPETLLWRARRRDQDIDE